MKPIAFIGDPSRGKDIIHLLEQLGGKNTHCLSGTLQRCIYSINKDNIICTELLTIKSKDWYNLYTIEEFEKEFPFKIGDEVIFPVINGWASGKVTDLTCVRDQLKYEVFTKTSGYHYVEPHKLSLYPMKEERNITLTLDKAKEWYNKGGELKEIALQAFSKKELNPLPRSWEEYCRKYGCVCLSTRYTNLSSKYDTLLKLEQLRDCWRQGWKPKTHEAVYTIKFSVNGLRVYQFNSREFLSFPTREMAEEFFECFRDLIEQAGDLI